MTSKTFQLQYVLGEIKWKRGEYLFFEFNSKYNLSHSSNFFSKNIEYQKNSYVVMGVIGERLLCFSN